MTEKPAASPDSVAANAARSGVDLDEDATTRIAGAVSPALATFDLVSLRLPMSEEPSGWTRIALERVSQ